MPNPDFTITVTIDPMTNTLKYAGAGPGGAHISAKKHQVFRKSDLFFTSPDGDLLIHFKGTKKPFKAPNNAADVMVTAAVNTLTPVLTTKTTAWGGKTGIVSYTAAVARTTGGPPFMISEDPDLEDGGGGGGGGNKKKKAVSKKKVAKKKPKKR